VLVAENLARAGFPHGFAARGPDIGDFGPNTPPQEVAAHVRRLAEVAGFDPLALRQVHQVHGARVVDGATLADDRARVEADALVLRATSREARAVGVRIADCVPVLVGCVGGKAPNDRAIAAIHAGWRGVVAGVVGAALAELGPGERVAAIGPCIGPCCFEVGVDVAAQIAAACGDPRVIARTAGDKAYVDLRRAVRAQLASAGVTDIEDVPGCTRCEPERFFSFRRDAAASGRHLAAIALPPG
jgi:YfiH family protein